MLPGDKRKLVDENQNQSGKIVSFPGGRKRFSAVSTAAEKRILGVDQSKIPRMKDAKRMKPNPGVPFSEVTNFKDSKRIAVVKPSVRHKESKPSASKFHMNDVHAQLDEISGVLPEGVFDIDADDTNVFNCKAYANDIINYAKNLETLWKLPRSFLENCPIKGNTRGILVDWLIQVQNHLKLDQQTVHMAVSMIDQFLARKTISLSKVQLLGITCIFVAAKFEERFAPTIESLLHLTDDSYVFSEVIQMELLVLKVLKFNLSVPTPMVFLERALKVVNSQKNVKVEYLSRYLLDLALPHFKLLQNASSLKATAVVYLATVLVQSSRDASDSAHTHNIWLQSLCYYLGHSENDVKLCAGRFARMIMKAEADKLQGARVKYSHRLYLEISKSSILQSPVLKQMATWMG